MINVGTKEQVADIFTKPFADKSKWEHAIKLINHVRVETKLKTGGKDSDAHVESKPHLTAAATTPTSRSVDQAEDLATSLGMDADFSDIALNTLLTTLVQDSARFYSLGLRPGQDRHPNLTSQDHQADRRHRTRCSSPDQTEAAGRMQSCHC